SLVAWRSDRASDVPGPTRICADFAFAPGALPEPIVSISPERRSLDGAWARRRARAAQRDCDAIGLPVCRAAAHAADGGIACTRRPRRARTWLWSSTGA